MSMYTVGVTETQARGYGATVSGLTVNTAVVVYIKCTARLRKLTFFGDIIFVCLVISATSLNSDKVQANLQFTLHLQQKLLKTHGTKLLSSLWKFKE